MTTTRLDYRVADLRQQVRDRCDREVAKAAERRDNANRLTERRNAWRAEQEDRVLDLARRLDDGDDVADNELAAFSIAEVPHQSRWESKPGERYREDVAKAEGDRNRRLGRLESVRAHTPVGESEPVVSLTPKMLNEWLGL